MRYWWVNQNQTFKHETEGGYLWSPKRNQPAKGKSVGSRNPFYENMREVAPNDVVLSFRDTLIQMIGVISSYGYSAPRPVEFGATGEQWGHDGWRVDVVYSPLKNQIRPKDHIDRLRPLLPTKYSPLRQTGDGNQNLYLTELPEPLAHEILGLIGDETHSVLDSFSQNTDVSNGSSEASIIAQAEREEEERIIDRQDVMPTTRKAMVDARTGQGKFKSNVRTVENCCRLTGVSNSTHLIASHIKPWRDSNDSEKLDAHNGLLLTPSADHLFDRGFISFDDDGALLISPVADIYSLRCMGVETQSPVNVGSFTDRQQAFLAYHRSEIFKKAHHT